MARFCPECGSRVMRTDENCPQCGGALPGRGGWLQRLFGGLFGGGGRGNPGSTTLTPGTTTHTVVRQSERIEVDAGDGTRVYSSLDDLPPEIRAKIEQFKDQAGPGGLPDSTTTVTVQKSGHYRFTDDSGVEQVYHSLDEMPDDVRKLFERFQP
ncbi:MAG: hypothetical protein OER86_07165 [Phycisphaerae bacterium]|nr:hypothetical protein [Phycisphaerae bacterium]